METWPSILVPQNVAVNYSARTMGGTSALSGFTQTVGSDAGIWRISFDSVPLHSADKINAWRSISLMADGRLNPILVPVCNPGRQPHPPDQLTPYGPQPHSDGALFSDGSGYSEPLAHGELAGGAAPRATTVKIRMLNDAVLVEGNFFSLGDHLYEIAKVAGIRGRIYTLTVRPPVRERVYAGMIVEFDRPVCKVKLASDNEMDLTLEMNRWGLPSVNFIEDPSAS